MRHSSKARESKLKVRLYKFRKDKRYIDDYTAAKMLCDLEEVTRWAKASQARTPKRSPEDYTRWCQLQTHHHYTITYILLR